MQQANNSTNQQLANSTISNSKQRCAGFGKCFCSYHVPQQHGMKWSAGHTSPVCAEFVKLACAARIWRRGFVPVGTARRAEPLTQGSNGVRFAHVAYCFATG
jgi:hypothetical protein